MQAVPAMVDPRAGFQPWTQRGHEDDELESTVMKLSCSATIALWTITLAIGVTATQIACRSQGPVTPLITLETAAALEGHTLFTAHCAPCHGPTGLGNGPAAIGLTVAPRDFFLERFRYVSTLNGVPTDEDLVQSIRFGRRYGEMPANPQLTDAEVRTLAQYVREIHRLGWLDKLQREFAEDEDTSLDELEDISHIRVKPRNAILAVSTPPAFQRELSRGRQLYEASCASCHGLTGVGDGLDKPLDEQGKPIDVRDLTSGEFRGGATSTEVFKRIRCGVPGTPMSAAIDLTVDEVWQLERYVRFLAGRN